MMKKLLAAALCLLTACSAAPAESPPRTVPLTLEQAARQSAVFLVDSGADEIYAQAAERFAATVAALTDNLLSVEVRKSVSALEDYRAGLGDIILLDSRQGGGLSPDLPVLAQPLLYTDYDQFTMALNSQRMLDALNYNLEQDGAETVLLAAYYPGTEYFLTARPLSRGGLDLDFLENAGEDEGDEEEPETADGGEEPARPVAALRAGSAMAPFFEEMGLQPAYEPGLNTRLYNVVDGAAAIAEITYDELLRVDWQDAKLNLIAANHHTAPVFLAVGGERWDSLPSRYRAVFQEACAYLFPVIDAEVRARHDEQLSQMRQGGVSIDRSFPALARAGSAVRAGQGEPAPREQYLLELLTDMQ